LIPIRRRASASLLTALVLILAGCSGGVPSLPTPGIGPVAGGQVAEAVVGTFVTLNPLFEQEVNGTEIDSLVYQGLTTVAQNQQVVGQLAKDWTIGDGGLSYTFNLRRGIRWGDGAPFTADDVMFTFNVLQSPDYQQPTNQVWKDVQVDRVADFQVKFTLKAPSAGFPLALRQGIIAKHLFAHTGIADIARSPYSLGRALGTGPFKVGSISSDRHIVTLDRNPSANPRPYLDHFIFRLYPGLTDALDAVSRGEMDAVGTLEVPSTANLSGRSDLNVFQINTFNVTAVLFNLTPDQAVYFNPPAVRQALTQAVDRRKIVRDILGGRADPAPGPIPPSNWAYSRPAADKIPYDPAAATKALQAAGWTMNIQTGVLSREGHDFSVSLATTDAYPYKQVAGMISAQLRQIGVQVRVDPVPASVLVSKYLIGRQYQMALTAFDNGPDPDLSSFWHSGAATDSLNFVSADRLPRQALIDKDLEDGRATTDVTQRKPKYGDFQDLMSDAAPAIFLFEPHYTYVVSRHVRGLHTNPVIQPVDRFEYITDWYVTTRGG
jgi:peptide/nickel transport system substrate-binding protein